MCELRPQPLGIAAGQQDARRAMTAPLELRYRAVGEGGDRERNAELDRSRRIDAKEPVHRGGLGGGGGRDVAGARVERVLHELQARENEAAEMAALAVE